MPVNNVDLVLVVDASESMAPCFESLRAHLTELLLPLRQASFSVRFGLVGHAAAITRSGPAYDFTFLGGSGADVLSRLYSPQSRERDFFTTDPAEVARALQGLRAQGNEDSLLALDVAADLPFGPMASTRRVVALFTDERLEDGVGGMQPLARIPDLVQKLMARRIQLFAAAPLSDALEQLGSTDRAEIEPIEGGDGLRSVDFRKLLTQMARSISVSTLQAGTEKPWARALFGQDRWTDSKVIEAHRRDVVLAVGESVRLDESRPIGEVHVKLQWSAAVDLDLHAFYRLADGRRGHVWWSERRGRGIQLDTDAGIGDSAGQNEENIRIGDLAGFVEILFATKIFSKGGCYMDYDAQVQVITASQASARDRVVVPLTSTERADWCIIARFSRDANGPMITNLNEVTDSEPHVGS
jgi:uncharacterized protein involved in tellurium resistance